VQNLEVKTCQPCQLLQLSNWSPIKTISLKKSLQSFLGTEDQENAAPVPASEDFLLRR
jgi:hypothetical protein